MTHAQRAMALAMIAPEAEKGAPGKQVAILTGFEGAERNAMKVAIHKARLVLAVTPAVADRVIAGTLALDAAYKQAPRCCSARMGI